MDRTKSDDFKGVFLALLIAAGAVLVVRSVPLVVAAVPLALAYALARGGYLQGGLVIAVCLLVAYLQSPMLCALLAAACVPPAVAAGYVIRKRLRFFNSVLAVSAAALSGLVMVAGALWLLSGLGPIDYLTEFFGRMLSVAGDAAVLSFYQMIRSADVLMGYATVNAVSGVSAQEALAAVQELFRQFINLYLVSYMVNMALLTGLLCVTVPRAIAKKRGMRVGIVPAFSEMALPRRFWLAYILSYLATIIGAGSGWPGFDLAEVTIHSIYSFVFVIQGLSFLDFLYKRRNMRTAGRYALHAVAVLLLGFILMFVGLVENIMKLRARMEPKGGTML